MNTFLSWRAAYFKLSWDVRVRVFVKTVFTYGISYSPATKATVMQVDVLGPAVVQCSDVHHWS